MRLGLVTVTVCAALSLLAPGCAHRKCYPGGSAGPDLMTMESALSPVTRAAMTVDTQAVSSLAAVEQTLGHSGAAAWKYYALSAPDCQCMAVAHSTLGNMLAEERRVVGARTGHHAASGDCQKLNILPDAEAEARNRSASDALQVYYKLVEGEARLDLTATGEAELSGDLAKSRQLHDQGLQVPFDESEFRRQLDDLKSKRIDLELALEQGNHDLRRRLGFTADEPQSRFWPSTRVTVVVSRLDAEAEVQEGLASRPEINMLRRLVSTVDDGSLESTREILHSVSPLLGLAPPVPHAHLARLELICFSKSRATEAGQRRRQVAGYEQQREQELAEEIRQAVTTIDGRVRQVALAKEIAASWAARVSDLEARHTTGKAAFPEISAARLKGYDAQGDVIHAVVAWQLAVVELKHLQGLLVAECGSGNVPAAGSTGVEAVVVPPAEPTK